MALFKIGRGKESNLPQTLTDGHAYFCTDTGNYFIDWADSEGNISRGHISAEYAKKLRYQDDGGEWVEIDPKNIVTEQVQANWNQTDSTADDFILNKPFGLRADIVEQTTYEFSYQPSTGTAYSAGTVDNIQSINVLNWNLQGEETYVVVWDGVSYTCTYESSAFETPTFSGSCPRLGNPALVSAYDPDYVMDGEANDCPFLLCPFFSIAETKGEHTIAIRGAGDNAIIKMDAQYLPDDVAMKEYVDALRDGLSNVAYTGIFSELESIPSFKRVSFGGSYNDLLDRPFGDMLPIIDTSSLFTVIQDTEFSSSQIDALNISGDLAYGNPVVGKQYTVTWDDQDFACVAQRSSDILSTLGDESDSFVGNAALFMNALFGGVPDGVIDTGEPFAFYFGNHNVANDDQSGLTIATTSSLDRHSYRIVPVDDVIKLDKKYLPDDLATEQFVEDQIANIKVSGGGTVEQQIDLIPEQEFGGFTFSNLYDGHMYSVEWANLGMDAPTLNIGDSYAVVWDDVTYTCAAYDTGDTVEGTISLGNGSGFGYQSNNEPFGLIFDQIGITLVVTDGDTSEAHKVRVYQTKVSSAVGVSSWNDLTDKPFYEEEVVVFEGVFQGVLMDSDGDGVNDAWDSDPMLIEDANAKLVVGQTYRFTWDGVEYTSECFNALGLSLIGFNPMNGEGVDVCPVCIVADNNGMLSGVACWGAILATTPTDLTISGTYPCKIIGKEVKKIDDQYQHQSDWNETDERRASFVKNKPFGIVSKAGVLYESDVSYEANDFGFMLMDFASEDVIIGGNYKVSVNGVSYTGVCEGAGSLDDGAITYTHLVRLNADGQATLGLVCNPTLVEVGVTIPATLAPENLLDDTRWANGEVCHIVISAMDEIVATVPHKYLDFIERHEDVVIPQTIVDLTYDDGGLWVAHIPTTYENMLRVATRNGHPISVSVDGNVYETVINASVYDNGTIDEICFGNLSMIGGPDTGEPFVVVNGFDSDGNYSWIFADCSETNSDPTDTVVKLIKVWFDEQATIKHEFLDFIEVTPETETDVLAETTLGVLDSATTSSGVTVALVEWPETLTLDGAQPYIVVWDGTVYECAPVVLMDGFAMGDPYIYDTSVATTGAPFLFMFGSAGGTEDALATTDTTATSHTVRIYQSTPGSNKIKEEYLPEITAAPAEIPYFDLTAMGLPEIPLDGTAVGVECDTSALREAASKGLIKTTLRIANLGVTIDSICSMMYLREVDQYVHSAIGMFGSGPSIIEFIVTATAIQVRCVPLSSGTTTTMTDVSQEGA